MRGARPRCRFALALQVGKRIGLADQPRQFHQRVDLLAGRRGLAAKGFARARYA